MNRKERCSRSTLAIIAQTIAQSSLVLLWASFSRSGENYENAIQRKPHHTFFSVLLSSFVVLIMIASMVLSIATIATLDEQNKNIFGHRIYVVKTDSMSPSKDNADMDVHFSAGDIIFTKVVEDQSTLQPGDIIAFISTNKDTFGETVTHMIREVKTDSTGEVISYVTYGTNTNENDDGEVTSDRVLGKYVGKIPKVGNFFSWMKSPHGYIICVLVPLMFLLFYYGIHSIKNSKSYS